MGDHHKAFTVSQRRLVLFLLLAVVTVAGYWLRFYAPIDPEWRDYSGGAAYVILWILAYAFLKPTAPPLPVSLIVLLITCCLEFLQLWHPSWLEAIRRTLPGRLILGTTFEWSDFPPYFVGAAISFGAMHALALPQKPFHRERSGASSPN
ncbi:MAG: DUF2809 domain-containing protein [Acidobacteriaceae bacterium]|nr:DUF2809 domain-containing protein [Acidobacteriaceae bacterium]